MNPSFALACVVALASISVGRACDLCAVYNANAAQGEGNVGFHIALSEQFTHSATPQEGGKEAPDPIHQYRDSSITSLILGYNFNTRWGLSLNLPYIHRSFKRAEGVDFGRFEVQRGTESGVGDISLIGRWVVWSKAEHVYSWSVSLLGGLEFPTGDAGRLREEVNEIEFPGVPPSGVHGDDLALGSGSWDGIVGASASARWRRLLFAVDAQYFIRSKGKFDYQFGNELSVAGGPGVYVLFDEERTLSLHAAFNYESKARDSIDGVKRDDGISMAWYAGPGVSLTWGERFSATLNGDIPLRIANRSFQTVPDYRVRGGVSWHF